MLQQENYPIQGMEPDVTKKEQDLEKNKTSQNYKGINFDILHLMESLINIDKAHFQALFKQSIFIIRKLLIRDSRKVVIFEPGEENY